MTNSEIIKTLSKNAKELLPELNIISFGSNNYYGDIDLLIFKDVEYRPLIYNEIKEEVLSILELLSISLPYDYEVFTYNLHRNFIIENKKIHLLYFPSLLTFSLTELPSLQGSISKDGQVISGQNISLDYFDNYINRIPFSKDLFDFHFYTYNHQAINYLVYYLSDSTIISNYDVFDKIIYSIKFSLVEIINEFFPNENGYFPDFEQLKENKSLSFSNIENINRLRKCRDSNDLNINFLYEEYFKIFNYGVELKSHFNKALL